ncbi:hypothetical protein PIB30_016122 [Stylosanthes scabra]|nr:hypothetical protein [Stylosanthes scabra]
MKELFKEKRFFRELVQENCNDSRKLFGKLKLSFPPWSSSLSTNESIATILVIPNSPENFSALFVLLPLLSMVLGSYCCCRGSQVRNNILKPQIMVLVPSPSGQN